MADWSLEEARAFLPRLRVLLAVLVRAERLALHAPSNGHGPRAAQPDTVQPGFDADAVPDADSALAEIESLGIIVRDLQRGLVDFPCHHAGREVLLCWLADETDIEWWHLPEDGFAGRRRLPLPPSF